MEINNWVDFFLYTLFTLGVIFVLVPIGINFSFSALKYILKHGIGKFPKGANTKAFGKSPLEILTVGFFSLSFSAWYLFIDQDGHIYKYINEVSSYFQH